MKKYFIPIIGTISAGKSTFLKALLGINVLQSGATTTTKFICLIKNNVDTKFYHVIPKKDKTIYFEKEGEETKNEEGIKERIKKINEDLSNKKGTKDDIFYMLETPIKNIENLPLLEKCYFMDVPGLNENMSSYIEIVFSLITSEDIIFEIMVFDSTSIGSDNIINIFKDLESKKCLKKDNNIFILNKIDQCTKGGEMDIIDSFKQYFYETFEDEKKNDKDNIFINIYKNYFIPMNSLLYLAETSIDNNFTSLLIFELYIYLEYNNRSEASTFYEFLDKRIETIIEDGKLELDGDLKKIGDKEMEIISKSIEDIKNLTKNLKSKSDFQLGINLNKKPIMKNMKKLFLIQKNKNYHCFHSTFYRELQEILKNIDVNQIDFSSPPGVIFSNEEHKIQIPKNFDVKMSNIKEENIIEKDESNIINLSTIQELEKFLNETFKVIDPKNEMENFRISLQTLRENILGRKLRIAFIGNISVGKSTVLNSIIGQEILPTKESECTYRGVIIRHKNLKDFRLYRTKLITRGTGLDEYYFFETAQFNYCEGADNIKSYLKNKNSDKNISDDDAYIVINGRLKIFDFIKLDEKLINMIEFIDLPGPDRKNNTFNEKEYYKKILKFSNCCIYMNEPKTVDDTNSVKRMTAQYLNDKEKVFPTLRPQFIKTCLFLINKSDTLETEDDKVNIANNIYKNMLSVEKGIKKNELNIAFFSAQSFLYFLKSYSLYVEKVKQDPYSLLLNAFLENHRSIFSFKSFKSFFISKINKIEEDFELELEEDDIEVPVEFEKKMVESFDHLYKTTFMAHLSRKEEKEIIGKLYKLSQELSSKDLSRTCYSHLFFDVLEKVIKFSENLQKENLKKSILDFFENTDILFQKEIKEQNEKERIETKEKIKYINEIVIPHIKDKFDEIENNIKKIIDYGRLKAEKLIENEIQNIDKRLEEVNNDLDKASLIMQEKVNKIVEEVRDGQKKELQSLSKEVEAIIEKKLYNYEEKSNKDSTKINTSKELPMRTIISLFASTITGVGTRMGLVYIAEISMAGAAASAAGGVGAATTSSALIGSLGGPIGIGIGFGIGIAISTASLLYYYYSKSNRYQTGLNAFKGEIINKFRESEKNVLNDFRTYKETFFKEISIKTELLQKNIDNVDMKKWNEIKQKYNIQKDKIMKKMNNY